MAYKNLENTIKDAMMSANKTLGENQDWVCGKCNCDPCTCGEEIEVEKKEEQILEFFGSLSEEMQIDEAKKPTNMQIHKVLYPTKNSREGIAALKKAFRVNDAEAKKMLDRVMNEEKDPEEYDQEGDMMKSQLRQICSANEKLMKMVSDDENLPEWVQSKVTKATDYIRSVRDYLESEKMNEEVEIDEKTLTPAEKKKREEVAQAIERDNPDMPMDKKMAIATATAKRVAEQEVDELSMSIKDLKKTGLNKAATAGKDKLKKDLEKLKKNLGEEEQVDEAVGTSAKYAGKTGMFGGKYTSKDHMIGMKNFNKIRDKRAADRAAQHKQQDPKMAKMGYAKHMLDTDKADAKARKRGIDPTGKYDKYKKRNNVEQTNEVLDTPKAMDSYRNKAKYSKDRATSSAAAKILRGPDKDGKRADHSPELKTMNKRDKGLKMVDRNAARKFRKSMNEGEMAITRRGDYGMEKVRMPDGSYKWKKKPKKEINVESRDSDTKNDK